MKATITPHKNDLIVDRKTISNVFFSILFLFTLLITSSYSQVHQEWVQRYNGPGNGSDLAYSIAVDGSGNVYVTGVSAGNGTGGDYTTIKYNSAGGQQWVQRFSGTGNANDWAYSIAVDGSGNVYVTGKCKWNDTTYDYTTIKYNSSGAQQWVQIYSGPGIGDDWATSIKIDEYGNSYVTGWSKGNGGYYDYDYATIKYNTSGIQQWVQRFSGTGNGWDEATSIAVDGSGNVYVTGYSWTSAQNYEFATVKYNTNGVQQWVKTYTGSGNTDGGANFIAVDASGNVYITGSSDYDYATIKYNANGVQQWVQKYNGAGNGLDQASSLVLDASGNVYVTGCSVVIGTNHDYATIKYSTAGVQQWVQGYNGPNNGDDYATSIGVDGSGNIYVTGWSEGSGGYSDHDYATIKYNSDGVQQWVQRYNGPGNSGDEANSIAIDGSENVYVTGFSFGNGTYNDYCTIKYSQNIGIKRISTEVPDKYVLYQNYPNPFNPLTKIKFDIPDFPLMKGARGMSVRLTIYDLLGREITTLVNEQLKPGSYEVEFDGSNYPSGVYFYRLTADNYTNTKKLVLLK